MTLGGKARKHGEDKVPGPAANHPPKGERSIGNASAYTLPKGKPIPMCNLATTSPPW